MATLLNNILKYIGNHIVVESGTSGIWTYKKYADGTYDANYLGQLSLGTGSSWCGGYIHTSNTLTAPSFALTANIVSAIKSGAPHEYANCIEVSISLPNIVTAWLDRLSVATTASDFGNASITIRGTWK